MSLETGVRIRKIREYRNYTQQHMAEILGISQNAYSKIESGNTKLSTDRLEDIAKVLDVPYEAILNSEKQIFNIENNQIDRFYGYIENLQEANSELIQSIKDQNQLLIEVLKKLSDKL